MTSYLTQPTQEPDGAKGQVYMELKSNYLPIAVVDTGNTPPTVRAGNGTPTVGAGNTPPTVGAGNGTPTVGAGNTPPTVGAGNGAPTVGAGNTLPTVGAGNGTPTTPPTVDTDTSHSGLPAITSKEVS